MPLLGTFGRLHFPDQVWSEILKHRIAPTEIEGLGIVQRHSVPESDATPFSRQHDLENLHAGERECLYLYRHLGVPLVLTDDLAVRDVARRLGITPVGSLGIIVRAHRLGRLTLLDAERALLDLQDISSLFVTRAIVEMAIEQLRQRTGG